MGSAAGDWWRRPPGEGECGARCSLAVLLPAVCTGDDKRDSWNLCLRWFHSGPLLPTAVEAESLPGGAARERAAFWALASIASVAVAALLVESARHASNCCWGRLGYGRVLTRHHAMHGGRPAEIAPPFEAADVFFTAYFALYACLCLATVSLALEHGWLSDVTGLTWDVYYFWLGEVLASHLFCAIWVCAKSRTSRQPVPLLVAKLPSTLLPLFSEKLEMLRSAVVTGLYIQHGAWACAAVTCLGAAVPCLYIWQDPGLLKSQRLAFWPITSMSAVLNDDDDMHAAKFRERAWSFMLNELEVATREYKLATALSSDSLQLCAGLAFAATTSQLPFFLLVSLCLSVAKIAALVVARPHILCLQAAAGRPWRDVTVLDVRHALACRNALWSTRCRAAFELVRAADVPRAIKAQAVECLATLFREELAGADGQPTGSQEHEHAARTRAAAVEAESLLVGVLATEGMETSVGVCLEALGVRVTDEYRAACVHVQALSSPVPTTQASALAALGSGARSASGPRAMALAPHVIAVLRDPDAGVRSAAAEALGAMGSHAAVGVPQLIAALGDENAAVRFAAAAALEASPSGPELRAAVPELASLLNAGDAEVRQAVMQVLEAMGPGAVDARQALCGVALRDPVAKVRRSAAATIAAIALADERAAAVPEIAAALQQDEDAAVRMAAAEALAAIGEVAASVAVPLLAAALKDTDHQVRNTAISALGVMGDRAAVAVPALAEALGDDKDFFVRQSAAGVLGALGPKAVGVVPELVRAVLRDPVSDVRSAAALALASTGPRGASSVSTIAAVLHPELGDKDPRLRAAAAQALGTMRAFAVSAAPELSRAAHSDADFQVRESAMLASLDVEREATGDPEFTIAALKDQRWHIREAAATSLGLMGDRAIDACDNLRAALEDKHPKVRRAAAIALQHLGHPHGEGSAPGLPSPSAS